MENYCYVAMCSAALGASAPTEGQDGRGHIAAAAHLQLVELNVDFRHILLVHDVNDDAFFLVIGRRH